MLGLLPAALAAIPLLTAVLMFLIGLGSLIVRALTPRRHVAAPAQQPRPMRHVATVRIAKGSAPMPVQAPDLDDDDETQLFYAGNDRTELTLE